MVLQVVVLLVSSLVLILQSAVVHAQPLAENGPPEDGNSPQAVIRVQSAQTVREISPWIYGQFLEHILHSVDLGLHAEMLTERSFELWHLDLAELGRNLRPSRHLMPRTGNWGEGGGSLYQLSLSPDNRAFGGDETWSDYVLELSARKIQGAEGFLIIFRARDGRNFYWWNIGGWVNSRHAVEREINGVRTVIASTPGSVQPDKWYQIRVEVIKDRIRLYLDSRLIHEIRDSTFPRGKIGLGTWNTAAEFRDVKVMTPDGTVLFRPEFSQDPLPAVKSMAFMWLPTGNASGKVRVQPSDTNPLNSKRSLEMIVAEDLPAPEGIRQLNVPAREGVTLDGYVYLRSPDSTGPVEVGLREKGGGEVYARACLQNIESDWKKHTFRLTPAKSDLDAEFYIAVQKAGTYYIDQVSLMPLANRVGLPFRDDLLEAVKALKPTIVRWPGGCFASTYNWTDGIGPVDQRPVGPIFDWDGVGGTDPNNFGTDEYLQFVRAIGAEPLIVLNISKGVQYALDWIEYVNGPPDSKWGAVRAANGHPEPYNVTNWAIDNEQWAMGAVEYSLKAIEFIDAIRQRYPDYKIWVVGSGLAGNEAFDTRNPVNRFSVDVIKQMGSRADFVSVHGYWGGPYWEVMASNLYIEDFFEHEYRLLQIFSPDREVKIALDEWNPGALDFQSGLGAALILNSMERRSDIVGMASPALWLRHVTLSRSWNNALINHDHKTWFPSVTYLVMKLWSQHRAPRLLEFTVESPTYTYKGREIPYLDVVATGDEQRVVVKVVNRSLGDDITGRISLDRQAIRVNEYVVYSESLGATNSLANPNLITVDERSREISGREVEYTFPRHSAVLLEFWLE
ncbi:MAG TPA: DUF1080 domain-containing protein [Firmicutes bacterium]|nr:DUF1080 domain-containing protein [Bacillota bacterium]